MNCCDVCKSEKGIERPATHDARLPSGVWAYVCEFCYYRLPEACKLISTRL